MRKIEVSGAFITPDITPAMPTSVNEAIERCQPNSALKSSATMAPEKAPTKSALHSRAIEAPVNAPTNSDGAKVPPTPPAALVEAMAMTLKNIVAMTKRMTTQSISRNR